MKASPQFIPLSPTRKWLMKNKAPSAAKKSWLRKILDGRRFKQQKKKTDNMSSLMTSWSRSQPLLTTHPDMTLLSDGTSSLSISSDDITSDTRVSAARVRSNDILACPPVKNIVTASGYDEKKISDVKALNEDGAVKEVAHDWVDFPPLLFRSTPREQTMSYSSDGIIETMMPWDDADDQVNNDDGARKPLFGDDDNDLDWNGFLAGSVDEETIRLRHENELLRNKLEEMSTAANEMKDSQNDIKSLQNKVDELEEELLRSKKRLEVAAETNIAINDAHDRKAEECEDLKRDMETFAYSFAAQHEKLEQLEGSLRKLMTENEQLRANKDFAVRLNSNSTKTQEKDVKVVNDDVK
jgi:hypothetical protein